MREHKSGWVECASLTARFRTFGVRAFPPFPPEIKKQILRLPFSRLRVAQDERMGHGTWLIDQRSESELLREL